MATPEIESILEGLGRVGYLADRAIATAVYLSRALGKPLLVEGPPGTGKTELAKCVSKLFETELIRLQCYEGLDEAKALYEWNYRKQLLFLQSLDRDTQSDWTKVETDLFGRDFLIERPVLRALRQEKPTVLLIDEVDRLELETEALLLEALSEYQVTIPELGTIKSQSVPMVFLTSNATRDISDALRRRCLYLHLGYPAIEREREIILQHVPELDQVLALRILQIISAIRGLDLAKPPSISEAIDWAEALHLLGAEQIDEAAIAETLHVLVKNREDAAALRDKLATITV